MKIAFQVVTGVLFLFVVSVWLGGVRLVVVPASSLLMYPATAVVTDGHAYRMIDSPQAMCGRQTYPATDCEQVAIRKLSRDALVKLPFNRWLYEFTDPERPARGNLFGEATLRKSI